MHSNRRSKLIWIVTSLLGLSVAVALVLYALRQNISLYLTPTDLDKQRPARNQHVRLGGVVVKGSVHHVSHSLHVTFALTDYCQQITIDYTGMLPALFREGQGVVAEGYMDQQGTFQAKRVLAKHDANYHPPTVAAKLSAQELA